MHDLDVKLKEATLANLESQRRGQPAPLDEIAKISADKKRLEAELEVESMAKRPSVPPTPQGHGKRLRRPPFVSGTRSILIYFIHCLDSWHSCIGTLCARLEEGDSVVAGDIGVWTPWLFI